MSRETFNKVSRLAMGLVPMALALSVSAAYAGNVGVDVNIHVGNQPQQVIVPAPVVPQPVPVQVVSIENDVDFVYPAQLGFFVAVGVPYDISSSHLLQFSDGTRQAPASWLVRAMSNSTPLCAASDRRRRSKRAAWSHRSPTGCNVCTSADCTQVPRNGRT